MKEYRSKNGLYVYYLKKDVDETIQLWNIRYKIISEAVDNQYKINIDLCKKIDALKAPKNKAPK